MVNIQSCDNCVHVKVCGKKGVYEQFVKRANQMTVYPDGADGVNAEECEDVIIDVGCKHYQKPAVNFK